MRFAALGDSAVVVSLGSGVDESALPRVRALAAAIEKARAPAILDVVPAFATVAVFYDPVRFAGFAGKPYENICRYISDCARAVEGAEGAERGQVDKIDPAWSGINFINLPPSIEIPVCYGGDFGPDLAAVAAHCRLSPDEVVARHSGADYRVHAIGFVPGFPYLAGLPRELQMARRDTPRLSVPAGSVGIGGAQTGVYPIATPGGWQLIGRSPMELFSPVRTPPALLKTGDRVKFRAISPEEFIRLGGQVDKIDPALSEGAKGVAPLVGNSAAELTTNGATSCIEVIKPGMLTTVQDLGRVGYRSSGVPLSGAMDVSALRAANRLVGNPEDAAALEITLLGPELEFVQDALVAVQGAEFEGIPMGETRLMRAGDRLKFGRCLRGCRAYLAVAGGIDVSPVLGSRSTYLRGAFGGFRGRALRAGDRLGRGQVDKIDPAPSGVNFINLTPSSTIRAVRGAQGDDFGGALFGAEFKVSPQSDRMGLRLAGPKLEGRMRRELISGAVVPGTVQVPPDGQPIVLMADAQILGGYPQAAHVVTADLPLLAQLKPGDTLRFREVTLEEAHRLFIEPQ